MRTLAFVVLAVIIQAQTGSDLTRQIQSLGRELRVVTKDDVRTYEAAIARGGAVELDRLLRDLTTSALQANPDAAAETLEARLRAVYDPWNPPSEYSARAPEVFRATLSGSSITVVTWRSWLGGAGAPRSHSQILAYIGKAGSWLPVAQTGDFLNDHGLFVVPVASQRPAELWFLAYGARPGSSRVEMSVALLAFDGAQFKTRWTYEDLADGRVQVLKGGLRLDYRAYFAKGPNFIEVTEDLAFVPDGVKVTSRQIKRSP